MGTANIFRAYSGSLVGLRAQPIEIEVDTAVGMSSFTIVGLADKAVKESKERISSAIKNIGASPPNKQNRRVTVNLAPADIPKTGSAYDLAIAVAYMVASKQAAPFSFRTTVIVGELALEGSVRPVAGALAIAKMAKKRGFKELILPSFNAQEASIIEGVRIIPVDGLRAVIEHIEGKRSIPPFPKTDITSLLPQAEYNPTIDDVHGQESAKRALEIAAAGAHNILFHGSPGVGKTMLAKTLPSILPPMQKSEVIEATEVYSSAGLTVRDAHAGPSLEHIIIQRPFRAPHHTASPASIIGGGTNPRPGEVSLAHRGVLFMDELPEFRRDVLEALRQPLEEASITVSRAKQSITLPANFIFIASMNPCPCGYAHDAEKECTCSPGEVLRYQKRISGPLLDRIDMHIHVPRIPPEKIVRKESDDTRNAAAAARDRVARARKMQKQRLTPIRKLTNAEMSTRDIKKHVHAEEKALALLRSAMEKNILSVRGYYRTLKVARTIADLEESETIRQAHTSEALQYRKKEK